MEPTHIVTTTFTCAIDGEESEVFKVGQTLDDRGDPLTAEHPVVRTHPDYFALLKPGEKPPAVDEIYFSEAEAERRYGPLIDPDQGAELRGVNAETIRRWLRDGKLPGVKVAAGTPRPQWRIIKRELDRQMAAEARAARVRESGMGGGYGSAGREAAVAAAAEFNGWTPEQHAEALERLHERARQQELLDRVQREMSTDLRRQFEQLDEDIAIERTAQEIANRVRREERIRRRAAAILAADDDHHDA